MIVEQPQVSDKNSSSEKLISESAHCFHCGEVCADDSLRAEDKLFCCSGCKQVYLLLSENNLCRYYNLDQNPGIKVKGKFVSDRFAYLDDTNLVNTLVHFNSSARVNVYFHLPQMHCSSCIYLLENLHKINSGIIYSQSDFKKKEVFVSYNPAQISLRQVVELLAFIGYEPSINLDSLSSKKTTTYNRKQMYKIGIAGFCFSNIMMLSFPEYFSGGNIGVNGLKETFTWIIVVLSLPVLFFSASDFFISAWKGLRQRFLNIDAPIALAIVVTFGRSYFEIFTNTGAGYFDSATGIVFFMLIGRWFQNKTYDSFSFDRDYRSYFPLGVTVIRNSYEKNIPVTLLNKADRIIIRNEEMIPADSILIKGNASIDYSFVSGENMPVEKAVGELIYAGGKQSGSTIELEIVKQPSQSYITQLWNNNTFLNTKNTEKSFIHPWSRYFTIVLFAIALFTFIYWYFNDSNKLLPAVSAVLIVACPCSLLLTATFTYGNMLRILGQNKLYLKNASVIESMAKINHVVFDKTGTLTQSHTANVSYEGTTLSCAELIILKKLLQQSSHPLSKIIAASIEVDVTDLKDVSNFKEYAGKGIEAIINNIEIKVGSAEFVQKGLSAPLVVDNGSRVHVMINNFYKGCYKVTNQYRQGVDDVIGYFVDKKFGLHVLSGDNNAEYNKLKTMFGVDAVVLFNQSPQQKLDYVMRLQQKQHAKVLMIGDGLNDAGALMQSDVGVAVSDNTARFSPACDAILDGKSINKLQHMISFAQSGKLVVSAIFIVSIVYNILGLSYAVQAKLSPMIAAILMPVSSISIVCLSILFSSIIARINKL